MELIKGRDFAATCVRFQIIARNDIPDKPGYVVKFYALCPDVVFAIIHLLPNAIFSKSLKYSTPNSPATQQ